MKIEKARDHAKLLKMDGFDCTCISTESVDAADVYKKSVATLFKTKHQQKSHFLKILNNSNQLSSSAPLWINLCQKCFCNYHSIKLRSLQRRLSDVRRGSVEDAGSNAQRNRKKKACNLAKPWLVQYAQSTGDPMPDVKEIHLPDYKWAWVYKRMENELKGFGQVCPSSDTFSKMRENELFYIKLRKIKRFAKCLTCTNLGMEADKARGAVREKLRLELQEHNDWQMRERAVYYKHKMHSL